MKQGPHSLLPFTPDTMRSFQQEIVVDLPVLLQKATQKQLIAKLPDLTREGREMSYIAAFEALRMFRAMTREHQAQYSDAQKSQLAEIEVEWCLDIIGRLHDKVGE
jgi:hypothetical protein